MNEPQFMYLWVRHDLSRPQQIVQASHAAAIIGEKYHADTCIALCEVEDETNLKEVSSYLDSHGIEHEVFFEPDLPGYTALATEPLVGAKRKLLRRFSLMK